MYINYVLEIKSALKNDRMTYMTLFLVYHKECQMVGHDLLDSRLASKVGWDWLDFPLTP